MPSSVPAPCATPSTLRDRSFSRSMNNMTSTLAAVPSEHLCTVCHKAEACDPCATCKQLVHRDCVLRWWAQNPQHNGMCYLCKSPFVSACQRVLRYESAFAFALVLACALVTLAPAAVPDQCTAANAEHPSCLTLTLDLLWLQRGLVLMYTVYMLFAHCVFHATCPDCGRPENPLVTSFLWLLQLTAFVLVSVVQPAFAESPCGGNCLSAVWFNRNPVFSVAIWVWGLATAWNLFRAIHCHALHIPTAVRLRVAQEASVQLSHDELQVV